VFLIQRNKQPSLDMGAAWRPSNSFTERLVCQYRCSPLQQVGWGAVALQKAHDWLIDLWSALMPAHDSSVPGSLPLLMQAAL
jgi:hypothetical protein